MILRIFSALSILFGSLGLVTLACLDAKEGYYTHAATSIGLIIMGFAGVSMNATQYKGGAATTIAAIMTFLAFTGVAGLIEGYILYREYAGTTIVFYGALIVMAIYLFLAGHRVHRMQLVINARLRSEARSE